MDFLPEGITSPLRTVLSLQHKPAWLHIQPFSCDSKLAVSNELSLIQQLSECSTRLVIKC